MARDSTRRGGPLPSDPFPVCTRFSFQSEQAGPPCVPARPGPARPGQPHPRHTLGLLCPRRRPVDPFRFPPAGLFVPAPGLSAWGDVNASPARPISSCLTCAPECESSVRAGALRGVRTLLSISNPPPPLFPGVCACANSGQSRGGAGEGPPLRSLSRPLRSLSSPAQTPNPERRSPAEAPGRGRCSGSTPPRGRRRGRLPRSGEGAVLEQGAKKGGARCPAGGRPPEATCAAQPSNGFPWPLNAPLLSKFFLPPPSRSLARSAGAETRAVLDLHTLYRVCYQVTTWMRRATGAVPLHQPAPPRERAHNLNGRRPALGVRATTRSSGLEPDP